MEDIRFYNFDFELLYILPPHSSGGGYMSIEMTIDLNGTGSLELVCFDAELGQIIETYRDEVLVEWRGVWGYITGYRNESAKMHIFGVGLNGLLHRAVIPTQSEQTNDIETLARNAISQYVEWLNLGTVQGFTTKKPHKTDKYMYADEYIKTLMDEEQAGYRITANSQNKTFVFECIKPKEIPLLLSESALNAYDFVYTYDNKETATGGWYNKKIDGSDPVWTYIGDTTVTGIHRIDTILDVDNADKAATELAQRRADIDITASVKDVYYKQDYNVGDIVRIMRNNGETLKKLINRVDLGQGKSYSEEPQFIDYEEAEK